MTEEVKKEYTINLSEDGQTKTLVNQEGAELFTLSASFTDEQIGEVYSVVDQFFATGIKYGIGQLQSDLRRLMGVAVNEPANPEK